MGKINLNIDGELLADLDEFCNENKYNRSEAIREAVRRMIKKKEE